MESRVSITCPRSNTYKINGHFPSEHYHCPLSLLLLLKETAIGISNSETFIRKLWHLLFGNECNNSGSLNIHSILKGKFNTSLPKVLTLFENA